MSVYLVLTAWLTQELQNNAARRWQQANPIKSDVYVWSDSPWKDLEYTATLRDQSTEYPKPQEKDEVCNTPNIFPSSDFHTSWCRHLPVRVKGVSWKVYRRMKVAKSLTLWKIRKTSKHLVSRNRSLSTSLVGSFATVHHGSYRMISLQNDDGDKSSMMGQDGADFDDWDWDQNVHREEQQQYSAGSPLNISSDAISPLSLSNDDDAHRSTPEHLQEIRPPPASSSSVTQVERKRTNSVLGLIWLLLLRVAGVHCLRL